MNLTQFYERWPEKEGRLFLFAEGKANDRLSVFQQVCDRWRSKVDRIDVERLHSPSYGELTEACRRDPLASKFRVTIVTELDWLDPDENSGRTAGLQKLLHNWPRDQVLIISTPELTGKDPTKNDLSQLLIRKGYWVVLKPVDDATATEFFVNLTHWDEEICREAVHSIGTSPADLIALYRVVRLSGSDDPASIREYLSATQTRGVFELVDAIINKDIEKALTYAAHDIPPAQLIGALDRKFTSLLQFMVELKKGRTPKEAALALRLPGFIVHGLYEATKRWNAPEIISLYPTLADHTVHAQYPGTNDVLIQQVIGT